MVVTSDWSYRIVNVFFLAALQGLKAPKWQRKVLRECITSSTVKVLCFHTKKIYLYSLFYSSATTWRWFTTKGKAIISLLISLYRCSGLLSLFLNDVLNIVITANIKLIDTNSANVFWTIVSDCERRKYG